MTPNLTDAAAAALGRAWADDEAWAVVTDLARIDSRLGGSPGEREAATVVADAFERSGVRGVSLDPFPTRAWRRGDCHLALDTPRERSFDAVALPYSPAGEVEAPLVDVGHGTPREIRDAEVAGRVAVASTTTPPGSRFVHRMETYGTAVDAGAVGFVFANHVPGQLPPTGSLRFDREAEVPAVGVSRETGAWLTDAAGDEDRNADADPARVRLSVDAETVAGESQNVVGRLGPDPDPDPDPDGEGEGEGDPAELLLLAHYDAHDVGEGALDNACGVAVVVAAARILAEMTLPRPVRVAAVGCEETGLVGAERLASDARPAAVVNVDGAGRFRDLVAMTHASETTASVAEAVADATGHPIQVDADPHPFSDQWPFVRRGVPALQLHSDSGERGRGWAHTAADTRDKVDPRSLRDHAMLTALLVRELAGRDPDPLDAAALQERFRAVDFEPGMRAAGLWPDEWD